MYCNEVSEPRLMNTVTLIIHDFFMLMGVLLTRSKTIENNYYYTTLIQQ